MPAFCAPVVPPAQNWEIETSVWFPKPGSRMASRPRGPRVPRLEVCVERPKAPWTCMGGQLVTLERALTLDVPLMEEPESKMVTRSVDRRIIVSDCRTTRLA
jgi:hypothetical protein